MSMLGNEPGGFDLQGLLAQAQALQAQMQHAQADLAQRTVTGTSGGDLVTVTMTGTGEVVGVRIAPAACDPEDAETLGDLVVAAIRDAAHQASALAEASMPQIPNLPF